MKKFLAAALLAASMGAATGAAGAQQMFFQLQDTNKDGFQTREELVAWYVMHIKKLDANGDGVSRAEFITMYEQQSKDGSFTKVDLDKDGKLKGAEITAMAKIIAGNDLAFCDTNKDGKISNPEERICTSGDLNH